MKAKTRRLKILIINPAIEAAWNVTHVNCVDAGFPQSQGNQPVAAEQFTSICVPVSVIVLIDDEDSRPLKVDFNCN